MSAWFRFPSALAQRWCSPVFQRFCQALWVAVILFLPVTSLPALRRLSGASTVAPPSDLLLLSLFVLWVLPYVFQGGRLPVESVPLLVFGGAALGTWALALFLAPPTFRDHTMLSEAPQAFFTLAIGLSAFLVPAAWLSIKQERLMGALRWVNWSGLALLGWTAMQAMVIFFFNNQYPDAMMDIQKLISSRRVPLYPGRVTGLAYEPSWLAHQLNMVYLPLWLSATLHGFSAHRNRLWRFSLENLLLVVGVFALLLSASRVGVISFMLVAAFLAVEGTLRLSRRLHAWVSPRLTASNSARVIRRWGEARLKSLLSLALLAAFAVLYLAAGAGLFFLGARFDRRIARALEQDPRQAGGLLELTNQFAFAERVVYWSAGLNIFADHPFFGVGLGNSGFYFADKMPTFGWGLWEVSLLLNYRSNLANTKSLWVRILAETGLAGFAVFVAWIWLLWRSGKLARQTQEPVLNVFGLAGQIVLIGFLTEGFSLDSFALPYFWIAAGWSSAAAFLARQKISVRRSE